jgi:N-acetyl-anhydromuramyl-L-alanine amidase AmpD
MRDVQVIVVHCTDTPPTMDIGVEEIRRWHVEENGWTDIGYHYVIRRDGTVEEGRPLARPGAHAKGFNHNSVGIAYVGGKGKNGGRQDNRTRAQTESLFRLIQDLQERFPGAGLIGHRDLKGVKKACPCFDVREWYAKECSTREKELQEEKEELEKGDKEPMVPRSMIYKFAWWTISTLWKYRRYILRR